MTASFVPNMLSILFFMLAIVAVVVPYDNWRINRDEGVRLPQPPPAPTRETRALEALAYAAILVPLAMLVYFQLTWAINTSRQMPGWIGMTFNATLASACVLLAVGLWLTWKGRLRAGVYLAIGTLVFSSCIVNVGLYAEIKVLPRLRHTPADQGEPHYDRVQFSLKGSVPPFSNDKTETFDFDRVELWVNGVNLGKTPVELPIATFENRVPYLPDAMKDDGGGPGPIDWHDYGPDHLRHVEYARRFLIRTGLSRSGKDYREYAGRARWGDEWAVSEGVSGVGGTRSVFSLENFVAFPKHYARLQRLINRARLLDGQVGEDWMDALESYGNMGRALLSSAARQDPALKKLQERARLHRGDLPINPRAIESKDEAWAALETLMRRAEERGSYSTLSPDGVALSLFADRLDEERLAREAVALLRKYHRAALAWNGDPAHPQFATLELQQEGDLSRNPPGLNDTLLQGQGQAFPPSAYVVGHAVLLHAGSSSIPDQLALALIRENPESNLALDLACWLGGEQVGAFLQRQPWRLQINGDSHLGSPSERYFEGRIHNRWLLALAWLRGPAGSRFREDQSEVLLDLARKFVDARNSTFNSASDLDCLSFLFLDQPLDRHSLASKFWPEFRQRFPIAPEDLMDDTGLRLQLGYLVRMGQSMPPDWAAGAIFETAKREASGQGLARSLERTTGNAFRILRPLPADLRIRVLEQIRQMVSSDGAADLQVERALNRQGLELGEPRAFDAKVRELRADEAGSADAREILAGWLAQKAPENPLVARLARDEDPKLQQLALPAIEAWPSPDNRALLAELLKSDDPTLHAAAQKVADGLEQLKTEPIANLRAD